ncbi:MAG: hypothetical protein ACI90V_000436 [Bacillariaceae sp.]|jgi:hypothetical protein
MNNYLPSVLITVINLESNTTVLARSIHRILNVAQGPLLKVFSNYTLPDNYFLVATLS